MTEPYKPSYKSINLALNTIYYNSLNSAKKRILHGRELAGEHTIDLEYLKKLWKIQNGRCFYSNIQMNYNKNEWRVS